MKKQILILEELLKWQDEIEVLYATDGTKKLVSNLDGQYIVYNKGIFILKTMYAQNAILAYNEL